jgi:hypothetical protein
VAHLRTGLATSSLVAVLVTLIMVASIVAYLVVTNPSLNPSSRVTTTDDPAGLQLRLNLTESVIIQGANVSIEISEFNTLRAWNDAPTTTFERMSTSPCPGLPLGVAIFQGDYSAANISSAQPLDLFYPGVYGCPGYSSRGVSYVFAPESDNVTNFSPNELVTVTNSVTSNGTTSVEYSVTTLSVSTQQVAASVGFSGYWTGSDVPPSSNAAFQAFDPGTYTVEGVDWWGHMMFAYFQVTPNLQDAP